MGIPYGVTNKERDIPVYCYTLENGETVERHFSIGNAPARVHVNGGVAQRDYQAENVKVPATSGWPMPPCFASGVNASQAGELRKYLKDRGCETEVTSGGDPIYRDKVHKEKALKVRSLHDKN